MNAGMVPGAGLTNTCGGCCIGCVATCAGTAAALAPGGQWRGEASAGSLSAAMPLCASLPGSPDASAAGTEAAGAVHCCAGSCGTAGTGGSPAYACACCVCESARARERVRADGAQRHQTETPGASRESGRGREGRSGVHGRCGRGRGRAHTCGECVGGSPAQSRAEPRRAARMRPRLPASRPLTPLRRGPPRVERHMGQDGQAEPGEQEQARRARPAASPAAGAASPPAAWRRATRRALAARPFRATLRPHHVAAHVSAQGLQARAARLEVTMRIFCMCKHCDMQRSTNTTLFHEHHSFFFVL